MLSADFRISVARENIQPCSHPHREFIHNWENVRCPFSNFNSSKKLPALFTPNLGVYSHLGKRHVLLFRISVVGENIQHYSHPLWEFIHSWKTSGAHFQNSVAGRKHPALFTPTLGFYSQLGRKHQMPIFRISVARENIQRYSHPIWELIHCWENFMCSFFGFQ